jgi:hypothetical protein
MLRILRRIDARECGGENRLQLVKLSLVLTGVLFQG